MKKADLENLRETWRVRVADFRASGKSGVAWCATNHIKEHQFWYWLHKFPIENPPNKSKLNWIPVQCQETPETVGQPLIVRIGQVAIEVKPGFDAELLRDVARTLASLC